MNILFCLSKKLFKNINKLKQKNYENIEVGEYLEFKFYKIHIFTIGKYSGGSYRHIM